MRATADAACVDAGRGHRRPCLLPRPGRIRPACRGRPADQLVADILEQWAVLDAEVDAVGGAVDLREASRALYHRMGTDPVVAAAVVDAVSGWGGPTLVAQPGSVVATGRRAGVRVVVEGFPDRGYLADGHLASRDRPGALVEDPVEPWPAGR